MSDLGLLEMMTPSNTRTSLAGDDGYAFQETVVRRRVKLDGALLQSDSVVRTMTGTPMELAIANRAG